MKNVAFCVETSLGLQYSGMRRPKYVCQLNRLSVTNGWCYFGGRVCRNSPAASARAKAGLFCPFVSMRENFSKNVQLFSVL